MTDSRRAFELPLATDASDTLAYPCGDFRAFLPRFTAEQNAATVDAIRRFAEERECEFSATQLAIAWVRSERER